MSGLTVDQHIHNWLSAAQHDVDTAFSLLEEGRSFNCLVFCHACMTKMLKGLWVAKRREHPPRTDNVLLLAKKLGLGPGDERLALLVDLSLFAQIAEWPEETKALRKGMKKTQAEEYYARTEDLIRWLKEKF
jgi:HEPN domain-containing protein